MGGIREQGKNGKVPGRHSPESGGCHAGGEALQGFRVLHSLGNSQEFFLQRQAAAADWKAEISLFEGFKNL